MKIRPASILTDLSDIVRIINPYESTPLSEDQVLKFFTYNPPGRIQIRLAAVDENDHLTGYSGAVHESTAPLGHFIVWVIVDPACRRQGIGSSLWESLLHALQDIGAIRLEADVLESDPAGLGFATRRGFSIDRQLFHSSLDLTTFDETPYLEDVCRLEESGIRFCSLEDFPDSPATRRQLYELNYQYDQEILSVIPSFEDFDRFVCSADWFCRAGQLLAVEGDTWVGLAAVSLNPEARTAYNENTVVHPAQRGRKIARALKVLAARYARKQGAERIETDNNTRNAPILAINRRMGYQPQPGKFWLASQLDAPKSPPPPA